uniref:DDE Tnp4 domain-containing protein n=1 Tax=Ditylenchus dipsaci TaxID=166011 RepID=A0A915EFB2_9BILA
MQYGYYESLLPVLKSHQRSSMNSENRSCKLQHIACNYFSSLTKNSKEAFNFCRRALMFRLGFSTVSNIVAESCEAIRLHLATKYLKLHQQPKNGIELLQSSGKSGNSPNTIGAIDGKHILLKAPTNTGSLHYNYKGGFSTVLLAICDADYKCVYADVGNYGKDSDGAFPLRDNIMRPFPGNELDYGKRIFNYRLSRARRVIEKFFGILSVKWRVLLSRIETKRRSIRQDRLGVLALHNFLIMEGKLNTAGLLLSQIPEMRTRAVQNNRSATSSDAATAANDEEVYSIWKRSSSKAGRLVYQCWSRRMAGCCYWEQ